MVALLHHERLDHERLGDPYLLSRWFTEGMRRTFDDTPDGLESNPIKSKARAAFLPPAPQVID
jgi:hypothetical protein